MNKKFTAIAMGIVLLSLAACKKESETSTHNPVGFWRGNAYGAFHTVMVLYPNGNANIYLKLRGRDTATAELKSYGRYTVSGNKINAWGAYGTADTSYIQTTLQSNEQMTGILFLSSTVDLVDCKLTRE